LTWQDAVLTGGSLVFLLALLPSVLGDDKPAAWTSLTTAAMLYLFAAVDTTLNLTFTALTTVVTASLWGVLLIQRMRRA
jgi:hypothetical protein